MINAETRQKVGIQYQVETELSPEHNPAKLKSVLEKIPHVQSVRFVPEGKYIDCVITVDAHADDKFLWQAIETTFKKAVM